MKIDVRDFQAIGQATVTAEGLTVIVGPSDRGKSALLRAIEAGLFNRTGDGFVRVGQTSAQVQLVLNGVAPGPKLTTRPEHEVVWEKGGGRNQFRVDGTDYSRVGREAPPVLRALGFRDEVIGGKLGDDGKVTGGATMRPQVARQFDPIFLLDQPGSFLNEVMVKLSRLGVLQRANRTCASDLRTTRTKLGVQAERAQEARAAADKLKPAVELQARVEDLSEAVAAAQALRGLLDKLAALVAQRRAVVALAGATIPSNRPSRTMLGKAAQAGVQAATLRSLLAQRAVARARTEVTLPTATRPDKKTVKMLQKYLALRPVVVARSGFAVTLQRLTADAARWETEVITCGKTLSDYKRKVKTCPTCERPFAESAPPEKPLEKHPDCARGKHAKLVDQPPVQSEGCINVDRQCPRCGTVVETQSTRTDL